MENKQNNKLETKRNNKLEIGHRFVYFYSDWNYIFNYYQLQNSERCVSVWMRVRAFVSVSLCVCECVFVFARMIVHVDVYVFILYKLNEIDFSSSFHCLNGITFWMPFCKYHLLKNLFSEKNKQNQLVDVHFRLSLSGSVRLRIFVYACICVCQRFAILRKELFRKYLPKQVVWSHCVWRAFSPLFHCVQFCRTTWLLTIYWWRTTKKEEVIKSFINQFHIM